MPAHSGTEQFRSNDGAIFAPYYGNKVKSASK